MSLLTIVQDAADQVGIKRPSAVFGNNATEVVKMKRYANQVGLHLRKFDWQVLRTTQTFTSVATEAQTSAMLPSDWDHFIHETFWNRSAKRPFRGPLNSQEWAQLKATTGAGVVDSFTYYGSIFYIQPVPTAGQTFAYDYGSTKFCVSSGGAAQAAWAADTDTARISEELFTLGIVWRFKQGEGLPYQDDLGIYMEQVTNSLAQDSPRRTLEMSTMGRTRRPGLVVPESGWSL